MRVRAAARAHIEEFGVELLDGLVVVVALCRRRLYREALAENLPSKRTEEHAVKPPKNAAIRKYFLRAARTIPTVETAVT